MGPALSNLDGLIKMPMGCGEQTIYLTGQAAIVWRYLVAINHDTPDIQTKALNSMNSGMFHICTLIYTESTTQ